MYLDLLKSGLDKPHLRNPRAARTPEQEHEYEIYSHMAWCVVETIFDQAASDKKLLDTWRSAIEIESRLHRQWFDRPDNEYKFRSAFREYINREFPAPRSSTLLKEGATHEGELALVDASKSPNPMQRG